MSKILIIDDDVSMTELLKVLVMMEGHTPITLSDSTKAIEMAGRVKPELITPDLMMPGLTGFEVCELLQKHPKLANIPILIVSARDDSESKDKARRLGAKDYLVKPFEAEDLLQKIQELTGKHPLQ